MKLVMSAIHLALFLGGIAMVGFAIFTTSRGGYVVLPTRFGGDVNVFAHKNIGVFIAMLAMWVLGGGFLAWLGWKGLFDKET